MKGELAIKNTELAEAQKKSELLLKEISASTAIAEKEKKKVAVIVESVSKKAGEISAVKEDAERDLAKAQPALDAAVAALNSKCLVFTSVPHALHVHCPSTPSVTTPCVTTPS